MIPCIYSFEKHTCGCWGLGTSWCSGRRGRDSRSWNIKNTKFNKSHPSTYKRKIYDFKTHHFHYKFFQTNAEKIKIWLKFKMIVHTVPHIISYVIICEMFLVITTFEIHLLLLELSDNLSRWKKIKNIWNQPFPKKTKNKIEACNDYNSMYIFSKFDWKNL